MDKRKAIGAALAVLLVAGIIGVAVFANRDDENPASEQARESAAPTGDNPAITPNSPVSGVPGEAAPTTTPATVPQLPNDSNNDARDVQPVVLRTPVRCDSNATPTVAPLPGDDARNGKQWVTVQRLTGACDAFSGAFSLRGVDTRVAWRSDATSMAAFLVDQADANAAAGYADAECAGSCSEYQSITAKKGTFNLRVQADGGPWEVLVQEYR